MKNILSFRTAIAIGLAIGINFCVQSYGQVIQNPSFENDTFTVFPGYISVNKAITGWTGAPADRVGLNPSGGSPFADNGVIPDGKNVAFIQSFSGGSSSLSTIITGLSAGQKYTINFRFNARSSGTTTNPVLKVYIDNQLITSLSTVNVGGSNPYRYGAFDFSASGETAELKLVNDFNGDTTILVDNFTINQSTNNWSFAAWNDDAASGVDPTKNYTHAYNFGGGSAPDVTINGVTFKGIVGGTPTVPNKFRAGNLGNAFGSDDANNITGNSAALSKRFVYGGNPGIFTIAGLVPGMEYVATFYLVAWEDGFRAQTFSYGNDRMTINQDQYGNNNGIRVMYRYIAPASGAIQLVQTPTLPGNTMHLAGFANYEVASPAMPVIGVQPTSQVVTPQSTVSFKITAGGAQPLSFQWYKGESPLANETNITLVVSNITENDLGPYYVVVSNPNGSVTSQVATLTFGAIANPSFEANLFDNFPGYVSANQPISGWFVSDAARAGINPQTDGQTPFANNGAVPDGRQVAFLQSVAGAPKSMWTYITGLTPGANYFLNFFVNARDYNSTRPTLKVSINDQLIGSLSVFPVSGTNAYRQVFLPFVPQNSTVTLSFTNDFNADSAVLIDNISFEQRSSSWSYASWSGDDTSGVDRSLGCSHAVNLGGAGYAVDAIVNGIKFQGVVGANPFNNSFYMTNFTGAFGLDANNVVSAGGGSALLAQSFLYYGGTIPSDLAQTITLTNLIPGVEYQFTIFGVGFDATGARAATFIAGNDKMTINEDAFGNDNGIRVSYRYIADQSGSMTFKYIPTDRNGSFHTYAFINQEINSQNPPSFYRQPIGKTISGGSSIVLDALVGGQRPLSYQWQKDGVDLPGETNVVLALSNVNGSHSGEYRLIVSNPLGAATSQVALVEVGLALVNPSFESDNFTTFPGYISGNSPITGWTASNPDRAGINPANGSPFANNGIIPDGTKVAFIQGDGCSLEQTVNGLVPGRTYYIKFWENSRATYPAPNLEVRLGSQTIVPSHTVNSGEYKLVVSKPFLATEESAVLAFIKQPGPLGGDSTVLIDAIAILELPPTPPNFITQPTGGFVKQGNTFVLNAIVQGSMPISYQWQFNGSDIPGEQSDTLTLSNITLQQAGEYKLIASNQYGVSTSAVAVVMVGYGFTELFNTGVDNSGALVAGGSVDLHYQILSTADPENPGPAAYVLYDGWPVETGVYMLNGPNSKWISSKLIDPVARVGSPDGAYIYRTTFILDTTDPNVAVLNGKAVVDNNIVDILINGVSTGITNITGFNQFMSFQITNGFVAGLNTLDFVVTNIVTMGNNPEALRVELDGVALPLQATPPEVKTEPSDTLAYEQHNITLSVIATGSGPLSYQWYFEGYSLGGETNRQLTLTSISMDQAGGYYVVVTNQYGAATSRVATLTVVGPPTIELDPVDVSITRGQTAIFEVSALSDVPMTYQWYWDDYNVIRALEGATNATLVINNASPTNNGDYFVVVSNPAGSVTSMVAVLYVVNTPPVATPFGTTILVDSQATIPVPTLLTAASDPDGDLLTLAEVQSQSANGGTVQVVDNNIVYTPPQGFVGEDTFTYTVSDGIDVATSDVVILVSQTAPPPFNSLSIAKTQEGIKLQFLGLSGRTYVIQRANKIIGPWRDLGSRVAPAYGLIDIKDTEPLTNQAFYRAVLQDK
ncbi:MAG: immunoglobulin domain-containing protein [Verrucomicrobiia bacterium]